jgi:hypothetical protein
MHYGSDEQSNDRCKHGSLNECILVKYIKDNPANGAEKIPVNTKVTSRDANWVSMVYERRYEEKAGNAGSSNNDNKILVVDDNVDFLQI